MDAQRYRCVPLYKACRAIRHSHFRIHRPLFNAALQSVAGHGQGASPHRSARLHEGEDVRQVYRQGVSEVSRQGGRPCTLRSASASDAYETVFPRFHRIRRQYPWRTDCAKIARLSRCARWQERLRRYHDCLQDEKQKRCQCHHQPQDLRHGHLQRPPLRPQPGAYGEGKARQPFVSHCAQAS